MWVQNVICSFAYKNMQKNPHPVLLIAAWDSPSGLHQPASHLGHASEYHVSQKIEGDGGTNQLIYIYVYVIYIYIFKLYLMNDSPNEQLCLHRETNNVWASQSCEDFEHFWLGAVTVLHRRQMIKQVPGRAAIPTLRQTALCPLCGSWWVC